MARVTAIIPARLGSTRFPRKALFPIDGKPLIYYAWAAAREAKLIDRLFVATDSVEIGRAVNGFGGAVAVTSKRPRNGSERAAEAIAELHTDLVVNIQADNVGLPGTVLDRVIAAMLADRSIHFATLARPIGGRNWKDMLYNPDVVKVVTDRAGDALWFSRYPIPFVRTKKGKVLDHYPFLEHIGVYFYRKKALLAYAGWPQSRAEKAESLEQLRILNNGAKMRVFLTRCGVRAIDSPEAIKRWKR
jgi:3-deoxy-manno-octulosonate cytidylyltransferase (CMP-KDO synthetase)